MHESKLTEHEQKVLAEFLQFIKQNALIMEGMKTRITAHDINKHFPMNDESENYKGKQHNSASL